MRMINLSNGQKDAVAEFEKWFKGPDQTFAIAGYAGTGKTTIAKYIAEMIGDVMFCAYTGKAANVLREKGCEPANTIHGYLYSISERQKKKIKRLQEQMAEASVAGNVKEVAKLRAAIAELKKPKFDVNYDSDLKYTKLVIVDEYSMLSKKIIKDLQKVCKKILYLGDPFQLPPIGEKDCEIKPDIFLTEIHRQALESNIIRAATSVRNGGRLNYMHEHDMIYAPRHEIKPEAYFKADQVIVGRNTTRHTCNDWFRKYHNYSDSRLPKKGEKVICTKNNHFIGLYNGMIMDVAQDSSGNDDYFKLYFGDGREEYYQVFSPDILRSGVDYDFANKHHRVLERFDYAYAITCHKSQGSEFENLLVYNEPVGNAEDRARWLYTAITRAKTKLTLVQPN